MPLTGSVSSATDFKLTKTTGLPTGAGITVPTKDTVKVSYNTGTTANLADKIYYRQLSLAATPTDLDLQSLTDNLGDAINFAEVVYGRIQNLDTTNPLTIGHASSLTNAWTSWLSNPGTLIVRPATTVCESYVEFGTGFDPGFAVGPTNKLLRLNPAAATISVVVLLVGRSA